MFLVTGFHTGLLDGKREQELGAIPDYGLEEYMKLTDPTLF